MKRASKVQARLVSNAMRARGAATRPVKIDPRFIERMLAGTFDYRQSVHLAMMRTAPDTIVITINDRNNQVLATLFDGELRVGDDLELRELHRAFNITVA